MRFGRFFLVTGAQLVMALALYRWLVPAAFWLECRHPLWVAGLAFLYGVPLSLFEYLYHRYLLHAAVFPFLRSMHRAHSTHHGLTSVKAPVRGKEPDRMVRVKSEYPVVHEHQEESMEFPLYAVSIFMAIFLILMGLPVKLLLPNAPAILSLLVGVTVYYSSYEVWHGVLHLPYERFWRPAMDNRYYGRIVRRVYGFHLMHHWRPTANLAIVGLWGFALWDYAFCTHRRPVRMPLDGAQVNYHDAAIDRPRWPISTLDRWQAKSHRWSRTVEAWAARVFLRRKVT
jgi:hypothetical protein